MDLDFLSAAVCLACFPLMVLADLASLEADVVDSFVILEVRRASAGSVRSCLAEEVVVESLGREVARNSLEADQIPCRNRGQHLADRGSHVGHQGFGSEVD